MSRRVRTLDAWLLVATFVMRPITLVIAGNFDLRPVVIYGLVAPLVGLLLATAHPRARFAAYVFLTMEIARTALHGHWLWCALAASVLGVLQLPRMRRVWPTIDPAAVRARIMSRVRGSKAP